MCVSVHRDPGVQEVESKRYTASVRSGFFSCSPRLRVSDDKCERGERNESTSFSAQSLSLSPFVPRSLLCSCERVAAESPSTSSQSSLGSPAAPSAPSILCEGQISISSSSSLPPPPLLLQRQQPSDPCTDSVARVPRATTPAHHADNCDTATAACLSSTKIRD